MFQTIDFLRKKNYSVFVSKNQVSKKKVFEIKTKKQYQTAPKSFYLDPLLNWNEPHIPTWNTWNKLELKMLKSYCSQSQPTELALDKNVLVHNLYY